MHRLMPLSPAGLSLTKNHPDIEKLINRGGFPEPYFSDSDVDVKRWRLQYVDSLLRTDVLDFDNIQNLKAIQLTFELLRDRVGSPISYTSLAQDVAVSPNTIKKHIQILEALYIVFRVIPYSNNIARSILKEPKIYFFDNGLVNKNLGVKFENFIALCLLKHVYAKVDYEAEQYSLHYLRTKEKKEVDFALVKENQIEKIIEVKTSNSQVNTELKYFRQKYNLDAIMLVKNLRKESVCDGISILNALKFLKNLSL